jgi:tape measure domain-containing protein
MAVTNDLERYLVRIDATTEQLRRELKLADSAVGNTAKNVDNSTDKIARSFDLLNGRLTITRNMLGGLGVGMAAREVVEYADTWRQLEGRLKIVSRDMTDVKDVQEELFQISQRSRTPLEVTTTLYTKLNQALGETRAAQYDVLGITEAFGQALAITGEGAAQATSAALQFTQAIAGNFQSAGAEINQLRESAPRLAKALEDAFAGSGKSLKQMAEAGELSVDKVLRALQSMMPVLASEFSQIDTTVGGALTRLDNAFLRYIGHNDLVMSGTSSVAASINSLADNFETVAKSVQVAGTATALYFTPAVVTAAAATISANAAWVAGNIALGRMAGLSIAAATSLMTLSAAGKAAWAAFPYAVIAAAAYALYEVADGSDAAAEAEKRYASELSIVSGMQKEYITASAERRDEIRQHIKDNLTSYELERQAFVSLMQDYLKMSNTRLVAEELLGRARNDVFAKIGIIKSGITPSQVLAGLDGTEKNIKSLKKALEEMENFKGSATQTATAVGTLSKKQAEWSEQIAISVEQAKRLNAASLESEEAYKAVSLQIEVENELRQQGYKIGTKLYESRKRELTQLKELEAQSEANLKQIQDEQKKREEMSEEMARQFAKPFENAAENIQSTMADTFEGIFDGSVNSADDAADAIKKIFFRLAAEVATLAIFRPSVLSSGGIGGTISSIFGGAGSLPAAAGSSGAAGGASGLSGLGSIGSWLASGSLYSNTLGGIGSGIGNFLAGNGFGFIGPSAAGSAASIGAGAFGNMGYGAIGGLAANLLGLGGGVGGAIGGSLGTLAGGAIGTSMGSILGMAGGPIGAIAGSFLGSALGGLFGGGKPSNKAQWGGLDLDTLKTINTGGQTGGKFSQENADFRDSVLGEAAKLVQLLESVGGNSTGKINITIGSRDGLWLHSGDMLAGGVSYNKQNFGNNAAALIEAVMQRVVESTTGLSSTIERIIDEVGFGDTQKLAEALQFGALFDSFSQPDIAPLTAAQEAMKALNDTFDQYVETAESLNFTLSELAIIEAERAQALEELRDGYNSEVLNQIRSIVDPVGLAIDDEMKRYQEQMEEAQAIGADTAQIETLHQLQLQAIYSQQANEVAQLAENFQRLSDQLQQTKDDLLLGSLSTLNPQQQYDILAAQFEEIGARARLGDAEALAELSGISK